jgi:hypothetical protein
MWKPKMANGRSTAWPSGWWHRAYAEYGMGFRMKTTPNIDDTVMAELKREAARQGCPN